MKSSIFCLMMFLLMLANPSIAQEPVEEPEQAAPLSVRQLNTKPWIYSMEEALRDPENTYKLSLKGQKLKTLPAALYRLKNLQMLDLSDNKLKELPDTLQIFPNLQYLSLRNNKLRVLPPSIGALQNLEVLYLGSNKFIAVPAYVGGLGRLKRLDVSLNPVTTYEIEQLARKLPKCKVTY
ncbi:MAG: leucine-rich repeat domain-containing protein [Bacteroidota bacterium]